jgi:dihydroxyacetone kinase
VDDAVLRHLDAATTAPAWPGSGVVPSHRAILPADIRTLMAAEQNRSRDAAGAGVLAAALACASALEASERRLTELDSAAGDGDLGISMTRGAAAIRGLSGDGAADAASMLTDIAGALRRAIAGSSGPFYAVGLLRAAQSLATCETLDAVAWAVAFERAVDAVAELGGAKPGDCTMLDALYPAAAAFKAALGRGTAVAGAWVECVQAAEAGAASTAQMRPRVGRASYLGDRALGVPDGGAVAVSMWLRALLPMVR